MLKWLNDVTVRAIRTFIVIYFVFIVIMVPWSVHYFVAKYETDVRVSEYNIVVADFKSFVERYMKANWDSSTVIAAAMGSLCNHCSDWPNCNISIKEYLRLSDTILQINNVQTVQIAPIVTYEQIESFERFAYNLFDSNGYPEMGISRIGKGMYAFGANGSVTHANTSRYYGGVHHIFTPVLYVGNLPASENEVMYDIYSSSKCSIAIDGLFNCVQNEHIDMNSYSTCSAVSNTVVTSSNGPPRPTFYTFSPIFPARNLSNLVGMSVSIVYWDQIFSAWYESTNMIRIWWWF